MDKAAVQPIVVKPQVMAVPRCCTHERLLVASLLIVDACALLLAFGLAWLARFANPWLLYHGPYSSGFYTRLILWAIPLYIFIFALNRLYDPHGLFGGTREYARIANACTLGVVVIIVYGFFDRAADVMVSRGWLLAAWASTTGVTAAARFSYRRLVYWLRRHGRLLAPAVILGANEEALAVAEQLRSNPACGLEFVGFVGGGHIPGAPIFDGLRVLGNEADLPRILRELDIHEVVAAPTARTRDRLLDVYHMMSDHPHVHLRLSSGLFEIVTTGVQVVEVGNVPLISLNRLRITGLDAFLKHCMDYGLTIPGFILISPLLLGLAILVKATSPGPIIYHRRVLGVGGRTFDAYKFRTMVMNADEVLRDILEKDPVLRSEYESGQKLKHDPRVTSIGRFLRKYSLDELPQVVNVLKGEMSLVGPRMIAPEEQTRYGKWSNNLLTVKPGITGPWQVMGRNDLPYEERVRLSMQYIRNYSIWTDLKILFQTFLVVVKGKGAY